MSYFVLTNDPDHGLLDDYRRVFRELGNRRILVTTAVFCMLKDDGSALARHCRENETHCLADDAYRDFMLELRDQGHEIAFHGYSQVSDTRDEFRQGLDIYRRTFGAYPRIYIEHGGHPRSHPPGLCKRENLKVEGGSPGSPYFVKDLVRDIFDAVWTRDYLLDGVYEPLRVADIFPVEDGHPVFQAVADEPPREAGVQPDRGAERHRWIHPLRLPRLREPVLHQEPLQPEVPPGTVERAEPAPDGSPIGARVERTSAEERDALRTAGEGAELRGMMAGAVRGRRHG